MKKTILSIALLFFVGFIFSQTPLFDNTISINQTFTTTTEIFPFTNQQMNGVGINGNVTLYSDTSLLRIILKDSLTFEYMVFESHPLLDTIWNFSFSDECEETCFMDGFTPTSLLILMIDADVYIDEVGWSSTPASNPVSFQLSAKQNKVSEKLDKISDYIDNEYLIWNADFTYYSDLFYFEKLETNAISLTFPGAEFYTDGIYAIKLPPTDDPNINYDYVANFDWRNRHGANNPESDYYDGDPNGGGWITDFSECQSGCFIDGTIDCSIAPWNCPDFENNWKSTSLCWAFGPTAHLESLINLYLNYHADINLSEQNIASCEDPDEPTIDGGSTWKSYRFFQNEGVVDEQTFPFVALPIPCNIPTTTEHIFIDDYIYYNDLGGTGLTEEEVRQNVMQNGPIGISRYILYPSPYGIGHAMQMAGWDVIEWEDINTFHGNIIPENIYYYAPWVGATFWIYKDSNGSWKWDNGFFYTYHFNEQPPKKVYVVPTDNDGFVYSGLPDPTFTSEDVMVNDNDLDGYCNWGIGAKPDGYPDCPDERDADDNDSGLGPMDEFGFCKIIDTYNSGFETSMNYWKQVGYDDCNWVKYDGESFDYPDSGPNGTPEGDNYLLMAYGPCLQTEDAYIESPPIDLSQHCRIEMNFAYHKNHNTLGYDYTSLAVDISYDDGQTWQNDYWKIDGDQGNEWFYETIYLPSDISKLRFHGYFYYIGNEGQHHDMAIDDITIGPSWTDDIIITGDEVWNNLNYEMCQNIIIEPNASLTINGGTVSMKEGTKIVVKRTGLLHLNGATLTSSGEELWKGVELWGNPTQPQSQDYQGMVKIISESSIENAVCGIQTIKFAIPDGSEQEAPDYNYTGGIILADSSYFVNNRVAVKFWPNNYTSSQSLFSYCKFITHNGLLQGTNPDNFIEMSDISGIIIGGCSFDDSHSVSLPDELTSGIEAFDAGFSVWPYSEYESEFTGLYYGIRTFSHNPEKTVIIRGTHFIENFRSIYLNTVMEATITGNTFNPWDGSVQGEEDSYCMYLDYCTDYTVEENVFIHTGQDPTGIGLVINNSGPDNNQIYRNDFTNLEYATLAQNCNRDYLDEIGLKIKCNDYWDNYQDIAVTAIEEVEYPGIARNQGAEGSTEMQAGNLFSLNNNSNDYSDYSTFKQGPINYFHHDPDLSGEPRVEPVYYSDKYITLDKQPTIYSETQSCPPSQSGGGGGGIDDDGLKSQIAESEFKADSTQSILSALVDGGNTEVLEQEVLQSMPPETYDLYMSLMGKSPYLSDSVLIAAIEKESVLPNVLIKDILVANPQAAKSNEVMEKVYEKTNPMTEEMLAEILLGKYFVAAKAKLEAQVAYYRHQRSTSLKFLKQLYRNDTVNPWANDSLVYLLETEQGMKEKFELIFAYAKQDNWTAAMNLINSLPSQYSFNTNQQDIYNNYYQLINMYNELYQSGFGIDSLSDAQKSTLYQLADNTTNMAGGYARNILIEVDGYEYMEPVILPEEGLKSGSIIFDLPDIDNFSPEYVKLYPNPAKDYIIVELLTGNVNGASLTIFDNQGKPVTTANIPGEQQYYVMPVKDLLTGIYFVKVEMEGKILENKKFSKVN